MYKKETLLHAEPFYFCVCATSYVINTINCKLTPQSEKKTKNRNTFLINESTSLLDSWVVVTSSFFIDLVEYSQVTSQWAWQLNQSRQWRYTVKNTPCSRRWSSAHFWIACSRSYSRAVCFVFWPLPRPLSLRGQPHSRNTGESQERHALKTVTLLKLGQLWRGRDEEIENTCVQRKCKVKKCQRLSGWIIVQVLETKVPERKKVFWANKQHDCSFRFSCRCWQRSSTKTRQHRDWPG